MKIQSKGAFRRIGGAIAVAALTAGGMALANPGVASAAGVDKLDINYTVTGNDLTVELKNNNTPFIGPACQVLVLNAGVSLSALDDPTNLLDPNLVVYPSATSITSLLGVLPGTTGGGTVTNLPTGVYAVVGACAGLLSLPDYSDPEFVLIGGPLSGIGTGSLGGLPFGS